MVWVGRGNSEFGGAAMERGPESLAEILSRLFVQRGWGRRQEQARLEQAWSDVAGPEIAAATRVASFRRGILEIEVAHSALMHELVGFHKRRLLSELQAALTGVTIKDLRFRSGPTINGPTVAGPTIRPRRRSTDL